MGEQVEKVEELKGAFVGSLKRSSRDIKNTRAINIASSGKVDYKRFVEDLASELTKTKMDRENLLDMSPTSAISLVLGEKFDPQEFLREDMDYTLKIRDLGIKLDEAKARYKYLFGEGE